MRGLGDTDFLTITSDFVSRKKANTYYVSGESKKSFGVWRAVE